MKERVRVIEREGNRVVVKVLGSAQMERKIEGLKEKGVATHAALRELAEIVNEQGREREVMRVIDAVVVRSQREEGDYYEVSLGLMEGGEHLEDEQIEYVLSWALGRFERRVR